MNTNREFDFLDPVNTEAMDKEVNRVKELAVKVIQESSMVELTLLKAIDADCKKEVESYVEEITKAVITELIGNVHTFTGKLKSQGFSESDIKEIVNTYYESILAEEGEDDLSDFNVRLNAVANVFEDNVHYYKNASLYLFVLPT